jgi:UDP-N-acetylmuramyl pentapeptide phosphotransferase/UDP-N-acetylglucosamine-1-phosphate transferase
MMHAVVVWVHVCLMMVAFGASPLGRLGLRYLLSTVSAPQSAQAIVRAFARIFLAGGISVTAGVCVGLVLAWDTGLSQTWLAASIALIVIAGIGGVAIEDRWLNRLSHAEGDVFAAILQERSPLLAALASPMLWLCILWLMIQKP